MTLSTIARRIVGVAALGAALSGCGYFEIANEPGPEPTPVVELIPAPTEPAPNASPQPAAPTTAPAQALDKLPALSDPAWQELGRGDFDGDGAEERALFLPSALAPRSGFADPYLAGRAVVAEAIVIARGAPGAEQLLLQLDRSGARGEAELRAFPADPPVAAFVASIDAESPLRLVVLPLAAGGLQQGDAFTLLWDGAAGAYRAELTDYDGLTTAPPSDVPAAPLDPQAQREVAAAAVDYLGAATNGQPAVAGALSRAGDYALAVAGVYGEEGPRTLYLRDDADGWSVLLDTTSGGLAELEAAGIPLSLAQPDPRGDVLAAAAAHLQDPRGLGATGSLVIEAFADSWARLTFAPANPYAYDPITMFFAGTQQGWAFMTAGTAFSPEDYAALRIPESVR